VEIYSEECPEYQCQECRGGCAVFVLARDSELRLCAACFEKLRDLFQSVKGIAAGPDVREVGVRVKSYLSRKIVRLRLSRPPDPI
jgi:hypothetical protein